MLGLALASIRTWGRADPQRNTRATQYCEAEHKLGKRHIGLRLQQEAGERPPSTSHVSLRHNEMAPSNTWESPPHCTCPGLMVVKKARQRLVLLDLSETLSSHSRCLETFTSTTENLVQDHHHLDSKLLHKRLLGPKTGGMFSRADCHNHPPTCRTYSPNVAGCRKGQFSFYPEVIVSSEWRVEFIFTFFYIVFCVMWLLLLFTVGCRSIILCITAYDI